MPKISSWMTRALLASFAMISVLASAAWAQQPPTVRIRGTIESIDGKTMSIKTREGSDVKVNMTDDISVIGIATTSLSDIKPGSYILVADKYLPLGTEQDPTKLVPAPDPKYFEQLIKTRAEDTMVLYRVKPEAANMPVPQTPEPPPLQWWQQFDTD